MQVSSNTFTPWATLPTSIAFLKPDAISHAVFSDNKNPHLAWSAVPTGTKSIAILAWDDDVPTDPSIVNVENQMIPIEHPRTRFYHWVVIDLAPTVQSIALGAHSNGVTPHGKPAGPTPSGGLRGANDFTNWFDGDPDMGGIYGGYDGMAPPWNDLRIHGYKFNVYALNVNSLGLNGPFTGGAVISAMQGKILAMAQIVGTYSLNPDL